jgi:hypothetical protein
MTSTGIVRMRLEALASVTDLVGTRIYETLLPQKPTTPTIRLTPIAGAPEPLHLRGRVGVKRERVQVDCYADSLLTARAVMRAVRGDTVGGVATGLIGWSGSIGGSPDTRVDLIEPASSPSETYVADELRQWIVSQDVYLQCRG